MGLCDRLATSGGRSYDGAACARADCGVHEADPLFALGPRYTLHAGAE